MTGLILNSGTGSRMGDMTKHMPKCMTPLSSGDTILSRQLRLLAAAGLSHIVITTGPFDHDIRFYCERLNLPLTFTYVKNEEYHETNYIYSIYLAREYLRGDVLLMHGDLVFERSILDDILSLKKSCMATSRFISLPEKDFKAVIKEQRLQKVGIEFFENAVAAQPLYRLNADDWQVWLAEIIRFCENGNRNCYAENALNEVLDRIYLSPFEFGNRLCAEIDTPDDLSHIISKL